jgi:hypothetical protein
VFCARLLVWNVSASITCFAHYGTAAKAFIAFSRNFSGSVADIAVHRIDFSIAFALITIYENRTAPMTVIAVDFTVTITSFTDQLFHSLQH